MCDMTHVNVWQNSSARVIWCIHTRVHRDVEGLGRYPKKNMFLIPKKHKIQKWVSHVGACYSFTSTKFPYYKFLSTISWMLDGGTVIGTNQNKWMGGNLKWRRMGTGWRRCIRCLNEVSFRKSATNYRALLRKMTYKDKASYSSSTPCIDSRDIYPSSPRLVSWLIRITHSYWWRDSLTCATCLSHTCDMPHLYVWHDSHVTHALLTRVTCLIHMCDMTHMCHVPYWHVWHASFTCVTWLICMPDATFSYTYIYKWHDLCIWIRL